MKFYGMIYAGLALSIGCVHHEHRVYVEHREPDRVIVEEPAPPDVVIVHEAPPPDRYEVAPDHRPGAFWVGGHYIHDGRQYVWVPGHWVRVPHEGAEWVAGHWEHGHGGYFWVEGHWR